MPFGMRLQPVSNFHGATQIVARFQPKVAANAFSTMAQPQTRNVQNTFAGASSKITKQAWPPGFFSLSRYFAHWWLPGHVMKCGAPHLSHKGLVIKSWGSNEKLAGMELWSSTNIFPWFCGRLQSCQVRKKKTRISPFCINLGSLHLKVTQSPQIHVRHRSTTLR